MSVFAQPRLTVAEARRCTTGAFPHVDDAGRPSGTAVLLDVREPHEWAGGHAPDAVPLSLSALAVGAPLPAAAKGRPLVVVCRSGHRSRAAVRLLTARGVDAVDLIGGMRAWATAGLPVVCGPVGDLKAGSIA
ncbi:rhodanese-like domain-containing protein [Streptomyces sp. NPDC005953]|uniref:rhodanese-like domain-containing protein n=1 Tax=Streptomyces sp. NPDC005953 TaxID=3156719 RepID=UPI003402A728